MKKYNHDLDIDRSEGILGYKESYIRLASERTIFFSEDVTKRSGYDLAAWLLYYDNCSEQPITLYINSNGGDISGLVSIYDVMQMVKSPIKTVCLGQCYSAAAIMLASGTKGERYALKNSKIMIHGIQCTFPLPGSDIINSKNYYNFLEENNDSIIKILAKHTNKSIEKIKQDCLGDVWMDAVQALEYGIIDHIIG